jgi:hypothetical protein
MVRVRSVVQFIRHKVSAIGNGFSRLTRRQQLGVVALVITNGFALLALAFVLVDASSPDNPVNPDRPIPHRSLNQCRDAVSQGLLQVGESGLVRTDLDGAINVQLERQVASADHRAAADATIWTALEIVSKQPECVRFQTVYVTVVLQPASTLQSEAAALLHAEATVAYQDLMLWAMGEIDDEQLSQRVRYLAPLSVDQPG